jgi:hypothetical protein
MRTFGFTLGQAALSRGNTLAFLVQLLIEQAKYSPNTAEARRIIPALLATAASVILTQNKESWQNTCHSWQ